MTVHHDRINPYRIGLTLLFAMGRIVSVLRLVTIEPLCFVYALAFSMMDVTRQDFLYQVSEKMSVVY